MNLSNLRASKRTPEGIDRAVKAIGCERAAFLAVIRIEAAGRGYDRRGRLTMLFEPHIFHRLLKRQPAKLSAAVSQGLAYAKWRPGAYPRDSYPRLEAAMKIDEERALQSASWGLPQILGTNFKAAGYASAKAMVADFLTGEDPQLMAMANFIVSNKLAGALRRKDWAAFARGYNGPGFRKNDYDGKLARAYAAEVRAGANKRPLSASPAPTPARVALPAPVAVPAPPAAHKEPRKMPAIFDKLKSMVIGNPFTGVPGAFLVTTDFGNLLTALGEAIVGFSSGAPAFEVLWGFLTNPAVRTFVMGLGLIWSKDWNVTGGTKSQ